MLQLCSFHLRNILDTIPFHLLVDFSLTSIFWIYSFGLMGGNRCLYSADDFNVRMSEELPVWTFGPRQAGKRRWQKNPELFGSSSQEWWVPCEETTEFPVAGSFVVNSLSQGCDFPRDGALFSWHALNMASWNPGLLGESECPLFSRSHIGMPYESPRIPVHFHHLRVCMCTCGCAIHMLCVHVGV